MVLVVCVRVCVARATSRSHTFFPYRRRGSARLYIIVRACACVCAKLSIIIN